MSVCIRSYPVKIPDWSLEHLRKLSRGLVSRYSPELAAWLNRVAEDEFWRRSCIEDDEIIEATLPEFDAPAYTDAQLGGALIGINAAIDATQGREKLCKFLSEVRKVISVAAAMRLGHQRKIV